MIRLNAHSFHFWFLLLTVSCTAPTATTASPKTVIKPVASVYPKKPLPMERVISQTRKSHGDIVVQSARLTTLDNRLATVITFTDPSGEWNKAIFDANTGKLIDHILMQDLLPVEKVLRKVLRQYKDGKVKSSRRSIYEGNQAVAIELIDARNKRWEVIADAHTGMTINKHMLNLTPSGKQLSLLNIIENARKIDNKAIIIRTRQMTFRQQPARELIILDQHHVRRKMIFHALSGELLLNKPVNSYYCQAHG